MGKYSQSIRHEWKLSRKEIIMEIIYGFLSGLVIGWLVYIALMEVI